MYRKIKLKIICLFLIVMVIEYSECFFSKQFFDECKKWHTQKYGRFSSYQQNQEYPYSKGPIPQTEKYDFIVVGSGAGGATVANRLSEIPEWNVLLLEAGEPENFLTDIPLIALWFELTDYAFPYKMAKQNNTCLGMKKQQCYWPRGKALGGTSVINNMIYTRGNEHDFKRWEALGNPGWLWKDVLPYYKRSERMNLQMFDEGYHNRDGELNVEDTSYKKMTDIFLEGGRELGHRILDYNGRDQFGFSTVHGTVRNGSRCSAAKAMIKPVEKRKNLRILPLSRVTRILIHPKTKIAYGVEYVRNRLHYTALAQKEVILSAGPIASPQLLMISGVGPADHLQELDIPVIQNLPVGQFLQDHLTFVGLTFLLNESVSLNLTKAMLPKTIAKYFTQGKGPLTSLGGVEGLGYIKTSVAKGTPPNYPDVELIFAPLSVNSDNGTILKDTFNLAQSFYDAVYKDIGGRPSWTILPMLLHPKSYGYLRLKSNNIFHHPIMHGNYFTDPKNDDIKTMIEAIRHIIKLSKTKAFARYESYLHDVPFPGCIQYTFGSDEYWECALRTSSASLHHQVGTCRMGPRTDRMAVVGNTLKVHGISRLRVIDSSVIPFAISAHTNAPAFMIGERGVDFIKSDWLGVIR